MLIYLDLFLLIFLWIVPWDSSPSNAPPIWELICLVHFFLKHRTAEILRFNNLDMFFKTPHTTRMPVASQIPYWYLLTSKYLLRFGVLGFFGGSKSYRTSGFGSNGCLGWRVDSKRSHASSRHQIRGID